MNVDYSNQLKEFTEKLKKIPQLVWDEAEIRFSKNHKITRAFFRFEGKTTIRKATKKDARKISLLRRRTLRKINKNDYPKVFLQFLINENSTQVVVDKIMDRDVFCMWDGDVLLGTVELKGNKILGLFIKSSEIKKGVGSQLMDFIENYARSKKIKQVRLYSTKSAVSFYKRRGYHLIPSGYWVIGKERVKDRVMIKRLK